MILKEILNDTAIITAIIKILFVSPTDREKEVYQDQEESLDSRG